MSPSLMNLASDLEDGALDFLWRQWCTLGVLGTAGGEARWIIDPEALLLLTSETARHDARLFDEVLDWMRVNSRWINTQRLSTLNSRYGLGDTRVMAAIARHMLQHDPPAKWTRWTRAVGAASPADALFYRGDRPLRGPFPDPDRDFESYGLLRPAITPRTISQAIPMMQPCALRFRLRALFGLGMRADILCYLLAQGEAHPSGLAKELGYSQKRVQDTLNELAVSGCVQVHRVGRLKMYDLARERWADFLIPQKPHFPAWIDWVALARGLTTLWRAVWTLPRENDDSYVASSRLRKAMRAARGDLYESGIGFEIQDDRSHVAEAYLPVFRNDVGAILAKLNAHS